jgi:hypothetical protein
MAETVSWDMAEISEDFQCGEQMKIQPIIDI